MLPLFFESISMYSFSLLPDSLKNVFCAICYPLVDLHKVAKIRLGV
jgi:hypothetical protein